MIPEAFYHRVSFLPPLQFSLKSSQRDERSSEWRREFSSERVFEESIVSLLQTFQPVKWQLKIAGETSSLEWVTACLRKQNRRLETLGDRFIHQQKRVEEKKY